MYPRRVMCVVLMDGVMRRGVANEKVASCLVPVVEVEPRLGLRLRTCAVKFSSMERTFLKEEF